jgi:hypothetical protein
MPNKFKTFKISERHLQMLREIAEYMSMNDSEVLRYLIWEKYQEIQKMKAQVR